VLLVASCKKDDFKETSATDAATSGALASNEADTVGWKTASQWTKADQGAFSIHYFTIQDSTITSDIADNGLVLVYKKSGTSVNALPFEETASSSQGTSAENKNANYWYHQVTAGNLLISCDVYKAATTSETANSFRYFIITPEKLQTLATSGYTIDKLMSLGYADAATIVNETN